jgi:hypothetical protein
VELFVEVALPVLAVMLWLALCRGFYAFAVWDFRREASRVRPPAADRLRRRVAQGRYSDD